MRHKVVGPLGPTWSLALALKDVEWGEMAGPGVWTGNPSWIFGV